MNGDLIEVRCTGCRDLLGFSGTVNSSRRAIYCTKQCAREGDALATEERTARWQRLRDCGWSGVTIARAYGVTHGLVYRVLGR